MLSGRSASDRRRSISSGPRPPGLAGLRSRRRSQARAEEACRFDPARLGALAIPTLLVLGDQSPAWASEGTVQIRAALPNARVAVLPGQAHMAHLTAPELLADEIARFLGGSTAAATTR